MLEKTEGQPYIHKLRIIVIIENAFNSPLKIFWNQRLLPQAQKLGLVGFGQRGGLHGQQATDCVLGQILTCNIMRETRTNGVLFNVDASGCFDREIARLNTIVCRRAGLPRSACTTNCRALDQARHHVKTANGISDDSYGNEDNLRTFGEGQGKGNAGSNWTLISSTALKTLSENAPGMSLECPRRKRKVIRHADMFVDDLNGGVTSEHAGEDFETEIELIRRDATRYAQVWEHLLFITGGSQNLQKSFLWAMIWDRSHRKPRLMTKSECDLSITVTHSETGEEQELETKEPNEAERNLGIRTNPETTWDKEYEFRREQSIKLAGKVAATTMTLGQAHSLLESIWRSRMTYPLPVTFMTEKQLKKIQVPFMQEIVPKLGFNRKMATAIRYGPSRYGGCNIVWLFTEQGIAAIKQFLGHVRAEDTHCWATSC